MKLVRTLAASTALLAFAGTAAAQDMGAYVNVGVDSYDFEAYGIGGKLGYNFNELFGVEGEVGFGIVNAEEDFAGFEVDVNVDSSFGAFGVIRLPAGEAFEVFGRAGYHFTNISGEVESLGIEEDAELDGFALGVGGQFFFGPDAKNGIRLEYTYLDSGDAEVDGQDFDVDTGADKFSLSFVRKF